MADNYLNGLTGNVLVGGVAYSFKNWKLSMKAKLVKRNNFTVNGFDRYVSGFVGGTLTCQGPYNAGNMPLVVNTQYTFTLQWTAVLAIVITAFIETLEPDDDAEDGPNVSITAQCSGVYTPAIS